MKKLAPNLIKIVKLLSDGEFHAGSDIGLQLNISRTAIWKFIKQLQQYNIDIESVKGRGYRLNNPLILLDPKKIKRLLIAQTKRRVQIESFGSLPSTNSYLVKKSKEQTEVKRKELIICITEHQSEGKGRLHRKWFSPFASNIYFSCKKTVNKDISTLNGLSLVIGLAIIATLQQLGIDDLHVKWPNDILWKSNKLAGCLIEITAESHGCCDIVIGIGINVNMLSANNKLLDQPWISLEKILGQYQDRNKIISLLVENLLVYLDKFNQQGISPFIAEWQRNDYLMGKTIKVNNHGNIIIGTSLGINEKGHLVLKNRNHEVQSYSSGDTSIVKGRV